MQRIACWTLAFALMLGACGRPVFTDLVRQRYALTETDLRRIQFYTSDEIVLRREVDAQEKSVSGNELAIRGGVRVEEVVIPARTPGVAVRVQGDFVLVSFAPNQPDRALWFGLRHTDGDAPTDGRRYELLPIANPAVENQPFHPEYTKGFLVTYRGQKYRLKDGKMWSAHLLYDLEESFDQEKVKEEPPGWRIGDKAHAPPSPSPPPPSDPSLQQLPAAGAASGVSGSIGVGGDAGAH